MRARLGLSLGKAYLFDSIARIAVVSPRRRFTTMVGRALQQDVLAIKLGSSVLLPQIQHKSYLALSNSFVEAAIHDRGS